MQVTVRDLKLLDWIHRFGYVGIGHIAGYWKVDKKTAYKRVRKLVVAGYLNHERYLFQMPGIYWLTRNGVSLSQSTLPPLKHIAVATLKHQLAVVGVAIALEAESNFKTERELQQATGKVGVGAYPHRPDGVLMQGGKTIAIEVELSTKGRRRLQKILNHYRKIFSYQEVWYLCGSNEVYNQLSGEVSKYSFLRVYHLDQWQEQQYA